MYQIVCPLDSDTFLITTMLSFCFTGQFCMFTTCEAHHCYRLGQVKPGPKVSQGKPLEVAGVRIFTGRMPFLMPNGVKAMNELLLLLLSYRYPKPY